jgi:hypothetical protein
MRIAVPTCGTNAAPTRSLRVLQRRASARVASRDGAHGEILGVRRVLARWVRRAHIVTVTRAKIFAATTRVIAHAYAFRKNFLAMLARAE